MVLHFIYPRVQANFWRAFSKNWGFGLGAYGMEFWFLRNLGFLFLESLILDQPYRQLGLIPKKGQKRAMVTFLDLFDHFSESTQKLHVARPIFRGLTSKRSTLRMYFPALLVYF